MSKIGTANNILCEEGKMQIGHLQGQHCQRMLLCKGIFVVSTVATMPQCFQSNFLEPNNDRKWTARWMRNYQPLPLSCAGLTASLRSRFSSSSKKKLFSVWFIVFGKSLRNKMTSSCKETRTFIVLWIVQRRGTFSTFTRQIDLRYIDYSQQKQWWLCCDLNASILRVN